MTRPIMSVGIFVSCMLAYPALLHGEAAELQTRTISETRDYNSLDGMLRMVSAQHFSMHDGQVSTSEGQKFESLVKKEPKYQCKLPFKGVAQLGSNSYAFALDSTGLKSNGFDRLYFDRNHNGDLTDEQPIEATKASISMMPNFYSNRNFPQQTLQIEADGVKYETAFSINVFAQGKEDGSLAYVAARLENHACREGKLTVDGKVHRIFVLDFNSNGRFDDVCRVETNVMFSGRKMGPYAIPGDMVLIDPQVRKDSYPGYDPSSSPDRQHLSKLLNIDGKYYTVKVTPAGNRITVEPAKLPLGALVNGSGPYCAVVYGEQGVIKITGDKNKPIPVAAGEWRLLDYQIDLTVASTSQPASQPTSAPAPKRKSLWSSLASIVVPDVVEVVPDRPKYTIVSARSTGNTKSVKVAEGKTETLAFGPPYRPVVSVDLNPEKKEARLDLSVVGMGGEECSQMMVDGNRPPEPRFKIVNNKGELVKEGKFEFG